MLIGLALFWFIGGCVFFKLYLGDSFKSDMEANQGQALGVLPVLFTLPFALIFCLIGGPIGAFAYWKNWI